jgi:hypothetical protein
MVCKNSADSRSFLNGTLLLLVIIKIWEMYLANEWNPKKRGKLICL